MSGYDVPGELPGDPSPPSPRNPPPSSRYPPRSQRRRSRSPRRRRSRSPAARRRRRSRSRSPYYRKYRATYHDEWHDPVIWRDFLVEFVSTFFLVSVQTGIVLSYGKPLEGDLTKNGLGMGFIVTAMVSALGEMGGVNMNPSVTFAMILSLRITVVKGLFYIGIQCCGGVAGAAFIYAVTPEADRESLSATTLHPDVTMWQGYLIETYITSILIFTVLGTTNKKRKHKYFFHAVPIGMSLSIGIFLAGDATGGSMNPARSLGPAVMMNIWENHWIYWAGPLSGSAIATFFYVVAFDLPDRHRVNKKLEEAKTEKHEKRRSEIARSLTNYDNGGYMQDEEYGTSAEPTKGDGVLPRLRMSERL